MSKKATAEKAASPKITAVKKGEIYENKHQNLIEVANGRLKDEGDLGMSFEGKAITFDAVTKTAVRDDAERFYIDELVRKLSADDFEEWVNAGRCEADAAAAAAVEPATPPEAEQIATPKPATRKPKTPRTDGKMSALDAAAKVLQEAGEPMATKAMIEAMATKGYWTSPGGQTPHATLYAAILREIKTKGDDARFQKTDRGLFGLTSATSTPAEPAPPATGRKADKKKPTQTEIADGTPGPKAVSELFKI